MSSKNKDIILLVDDDTFFRKMIIAGLSHYFEIKEAKNKIEAVSIIETGMVHAILLDLRLHGDESDDFEGLEIISEIKSERPMLPVVVMTSFANIPLSVKAMQLGADDFIEKGKIEVEEIKGKLEKLIAIKRNDLKIKAIVDEQFLSNLSGLIGESPLLTEVKKRSLLAANDGYCTVLILGETGTGKELIARSIHEQGWRKEGPFRAINISSLNPGLIESELFGYEKGAFTGANFSKEGYIEQSNSGILFIDEIGDITTEIQVKLLRFLEERIVYKVGSTKARPIDVQLVFATNLNPLHLVETGKFRQDFYYRIKTVEIVSPALRDRKEDIPLLADHFLQLLRKQGRTKIVGFSDEAINTICQYNYPGNIRELKAIIEWATLNANQANHWVIEADDIPYDIKKEVISKSITTPLDFDIEKDLNVEYARAKTELLCLERALKLTSGKKLKAEEILGYPNRQTMRRRIKRLKSAYPELFNEFELIKLLYGNIENEF